MAMSKVIGEWMEDLRKREEEERDERMRRYITANLNTMLRELGGVDLTPAERRSLEWLASMERDTCERFASIFRKSRR